MGGKPVEGPAERTRRRLDEYDATGDPELISSASALSDAQALLFAGTDDATWEPGIVIAGQRLAAGLFWRRFLCSNAVDENDPRASIRVAVPYSADDSEALLDIRVRVDEDDGASQDLTIALWLYAMLPPEHDDVPVPLRPLCKVRREVSAWRFYRASREISSLLDEFDQTGGPQLPRQAHAAVLALGDGARGMIRHLNQEGISSYLVLQCDVLRCLYSAERDREMLRTLLGLLRQGLAHGMLLGADRYRATEVVLRVMAESHAWVALGDETPRATREALSGSAAGAESAEERDRALVLLGKLLLFWSAADPDPALLDAAIGHLRAALTRVRGTAEHIPVLWALHAALARRHKRRRAPADRAAADEALIALGSADHDTLPDVQTRSHALTRLGIHAWKAHLRTGASRTERWRRRHCALPCARPRRAACKFRGCCASSPLPGLRRSAARPCRPSHER